MAVGPCILAIDLGTSGPKVALVSVKGAVLDSAFAPTQLLLFPGGGAEQDPEGWWRAVVAATRQMLAGRPEEANEIVAVAVTAQWSGTVPVDREGRPLGNAHIWMDSRGASVIAEATDGVLPIKGNGLFKLIRWLRLTGGVPGASGKDAIAHILYLRKHSPELYERTFKFLEPTDWLNARLTGRLAASYASITLYWATDNRDLSRVRYDDKILSWYGIDREKLPELHPTTDVLGPVLPSVAEELGIPATARVVMGAPDMHAATVGAGAVADGVAQLYVGTSSFITGHVPFKKADLTHSIATLPSALPDRYLAASTQETAGLCASHLIDQLVYPDDELATAPRPTDAYERLDRAVAQVPPGADQLLFLPWLYGERTPVEDATLRGGFLNLSLKTTRRHLARAVLEGVALNSRWSLGYLEKLMGRRQESLAMIGGGARSEQWCQIHADVFGIPVKQVANPVQANAQGVGFLALLSLGYLKREDLPGCVRVARTWEPRPAYRALYDDLFGAFLETYRRNRKLFARLNRQ